MSVKRSRAEKPEIKAQTAYRGIGAIIVMLAHFVILKATPQGTDFILDLGTNVTIVLDLFFVLSGYIMAYIYADVFTDGIRARPTRKFFWNRLVRTYPLHIFAILVLLIERAVQVWLASRGSGFVGSDDATFFNFFDTPWRLVTSIFLLHAWGLNTELSWNFPSWALSAEFAAYFTFPFLCLVIGRFGRRGALMLIAFSAISYFIIVNVFGTINNVPAMIGALRSIPGFALGVAAYTLSGPMRTMSRSRLEVFQTLAFAATMAAFVYADNQMLIVAGIAVTLVATSENRGWVSTMFSWQPLQFLGKISYTIYVMHVVTGYAMSPFLRILGERLGVDEASWWLTAGILAKMVGTVIVSTIAFNVIEMPARVLLERTVARRRHPSGGVVPPSAPAATPTTQQTEVSKA